MNEIRTEEKRKRIPERWILLLCCCLLTCGTTGMAGMLGLFYSPVCTDLGILRGTFTLQSIIGTAVGSVTTMFMPAMLRRFPVRTLVTAAVITGSCCLLLNSFWNGVAGFYVTAAVRSAAATYYSGVITFMFINSWFVTNNGLASSIMMCFSGVAGALFSPVFSAVIRNEGWRAGYRVMAAAMLALSLPLIFFPGSLIKAPEEEERQSEKKTDASTEKDRGSFRLLVALMVTDFLITSFVSHISGFCEVRGLASGTAAVVLSCAMVGNILFKLADGLLSDRMGVRNSSLVLFAIPSVAFVLFLFSESALSYCAAGFLCGAANACCGLALNLIIRDVYGSSRYGEVRSSATVFSSAAYSGGTAAVGYVYDFTGSYDVVLTVFAVLGVLQVALLVLLYRRKAAGLV